MIDLGGEGDDGCFEREVVELEPHLELATLEGGFRWAGDVNVPDGIAFSLNDVVPGLPQIYSFSSSCLSLLSRAAMIQDINIRILIKLMTCLVLILSLHSF